MRIADFTAVAAHPTADARLQKHATEFEGILLTELMSKMQRTFSQTESGSEGDPASDTLSSMGTQALAQALAQRNVLGIGAMVAKSLSGTTTPVTGGGLLQTGWKADVEVEK